MIIINRLQTSYQAFNVIIRIRCVSADQRDVIAEKAPKKYNKDPLISGAFVCRLVVGPITKPDSDFEFQNANF